MTLLVIVVAIAVQRYLQFLSATYRWDWMGYYYEWMASKIEYVTKGHGLLGLAILVVPALLVVSMVFALMYHLLGALGYYILSVAIFWYCIDARDIVKQPYKAATPMKLLIKVYQSLFGMIFWFGVFGPVGLTLYYVVLYFRDYLLGRQDAEAKELETYSQSVLSVLDWVPQRLFTLSFALVGHFTVVFKEWVKTLFSGLDPKLALITSCSQAVAKTKEEAISLLSRVLIVWLIVMALITAGTFLS